MTSELAQDTAAAAAQTNAAPRAATLSPGALRSETWMTLQTRQAQRLVHGREPSEAKAAIIGLTRFSALVRQIWIGARADDPYADWWMLKIHDALELSQGELEAMRQLAEARLASVPAIDIAVAHSVEPVRVPLQFSHAYAFRGAYLVAAFDEVVRALLTARHVGLMGREESERAISEAARVVRRAFTSPTGYRFLGITRDDVGRGGARVLQAKSEMGEVPAEILQGERAAPYGPKSQGGFAALNTAAHASSPVAPPTD